MGTVSMPDNASGVNRPLFAINSRNAPEKISRAVSLSGERASRLHSYLWQTMNEDLYWFFLAQVPAMLGSRLPPKPAGDSVKS
ncbi:Hypothetical protein NTJ_05954 [Nesidiocoris tenuis]|uniref:Uncharacterized protein n=1 Tax=Nesidiocoris tenuis TaxID=355587 RepID=A0ABN7ALN7_9HEMI|nr:Hypothetical protein NTJ_05954 [Nesidiocoris tenuis]